MKHWLSKAWILFGVLLLTACSNELIAPTTTTHSTSNPDAEEVFTLYENVDTFQWEGLMHIAGVNWIDELEWTPKEEVGKISKQTDQPEEFKDGAANQLPVGTIIYSANERGDVLLVEKGGKWLAYYKLVEG